MKISCLLTTFFFFFLLVIAENSVYQSHSLPVKISIFLFYLIYFLFVFCKNPEPCYAKWWNSCNEIVTRRSSSDDRKSKVHFQNSGLRGKKERKEGKRRRGKKKKRFIGWKRTCRVNKSFTKRHENDVFLFYLFFPLRTPIRSNARFILWVLTCMGFGINRSKYVFSAKYHHI